MSLGHIGSRVTIWWLTCLPLVITAVYWYFGLGHADAAAVVLWWPVAYTAYVYGRMREREKYDARAYLSEDEYPDGGMFS